MIARGLPNSGNSAGAERSAPETHNDATIAAANKNLAFSAADIANSFLWLKRPVILPYVHCANARTRRLAFQERA